MAQLVGALLCTPRGWGFDSQSGHMPRSGVQSPVEMGMGGRQSMSDCLSLSPPPLKSINYSFFKDFIYLFSEKRKKERNINVWLPLTRPLLGTWVATPTHALTGNQTCNPLVHRLPLNPLSHTSQGSVNIFF